MPRRREVAACLGIVSEVRPYKAIVSFGIDGKHEQAILKIDKLSIQGKRVRSTLLTDVLCVGSVVKFWAHTLSRLGVDDCGWYITNAFLRDFETEFGHGTGPTRETVDYMQGFYNQSGRIGEVNGRMGTIRFADGSGTRHTVFFTASKLFLSGRNFERDGNLEDVLHPYERVFFDAIPTFKENNARSCEWFASLVWVGTRPAVYKSSVSRTHVNLLSLLRGEYSAYLYQLCDAKSSFVKAEGRVMFNINHAFGVVLLVMKTNVLQTAFFHRNDAFFYGNNMAHCDLRKFFREGDRIKFIGVEAPHGLLTKFIATEISAGSGRRRIV